jgi:urease accessory protein
MVNRAVGGCLNNQAVSCYSVILALIGSLASNPCFAHGLGGSGWLHPLTGIDHMSAMIAVGAWSAQLGGPAIYLVPSVFVCAMAIGGAIGLERVVLTGTEAGIAVSILCLGIAICCEGRLAIPLASLAVAVFGSCHGYAHGYEMPLTQDKLSYVVGFLTTTAGLHLAGAVGALLLLERPTGNVALRVCGAMAGFAGMFFCGSLL